MTRRKRRNHSPAFKAKVALAAIRGERTLAQLAEQYDLHANQIQDWKKKLTASAEGVFGENAAQAEAVDKDQDKLLNKIGQLTMENYFSSKALGQDR